MQTSYIWLLLVPVAAKLLDQVPESVTIAGFEPPLGIRLQLPFSWLVFYFSALAFTIGSLVYRWRCPRLLRITNHFGDFERQGRPFWDIQDQAKRFLAADQVDRIVGKAGRQNSAHELRRAYWELVPKLEGVQPVALRLTAGFFGAGLVGTVIVTVQGLVAVLRLVLI